MKNYLIEAMELIEFPAECVESLLTEWDDIKDGNIGKVILPIARIGEQTAESLKKAAAAWSVSMAAAAISESAVDDKHFFITSGAGS